MAIRYTKYGYRPQTRRIQRTSLVVDPTAGLHSGAGPYRTAPYLPAVDNFVQDNAAAAPRSGLSQFSGGSTGISNVRVGQELFDTFGNAIYAVVSNRSIAIYPVLNPPVGDWSVLSRLGTPLSTTTRDYAEIAHIAEDATNTIALVTNGVDTPKVFDVSDNATTWSDFTNAFSLLSTARTVTVSDERLVWGNTKSAGGARPTRIAWSVRGAPKNHVLAQGAGFIDLSEMRGEVLRIVSDQEGFVIFSNLEIWRARPRRDNFAFDFFPISREISCPFPRTAAVTPFGVVFLGSDYDVYTIAGSQLSSLGRAESTHESRVKQFVEDNVDDGDNLWAVYSLKEQRYELHLQNNRGLFYDFGTRSWWPQTFTNHDLIAGFEVTDPAPYTEALKTWDDMIGQWGESVDRWDESTINRPPIESRQVLAFTTNGSVYRFRPDQLSDDGINFNLAITTHSLRQTRARLAQVEGVWVEYDASSTGTAQVAVRTDASVSTQVFSFASSTNSVGFVGLRAVDRNPRIKITYPSSVRANLSALEVDLAARGTMSGRF